MVTDRASSELGVTDLASFRRWAATLKGEVILPVDAAYDASRRIWNLDIDRRPAAIVRCADETDVVRAVDFGRTQGLVVAVRSGGHSQAGHSTCDGGMVIDLGRLNQVDVDRGARVARVEAGTRVGAMLDAMRAVGMTTPSGGCPDVGIGGLTLGGGESFLMARYGAVCDNLLSAQVVTAAGRIVTASADEHADLYWAIRGGGGNFGIVTAFAFQAPSSRSRPVRSLSVSGESDAGGRAPVSGPDDQRTRRAADIRRHRVL